MTRESVTFPPGTSCVAVDDETTYLSDQDIAAGRIPNNTRTTKQTAVSFVVGFNGTLKKKLVVLYLHMSQQNLKL